MILVKCCQAADRQPRPALSWFHFQGLSVLLMLGSVSQCSFPTLAWILHYVWLPNRYFHPLVAAKTLFSCSHRSLNPHTSFSQVGWATTLIFFFQKCMAQSLWNMELNWSSVEVIYYLYFFLCYLLFTDDLHLPNKHKEVFLPGEKKKRDQNMQLM